MRLKGWHIDGFGLFSDYEVKDLSPEINLFVGPNEAGKSTLLAFLRRVFFGYPDGRSREGLYPPLRGGRHGGRVFIDWRDDPYSIERFSGRGEVAHILRPDGSEGTDADLHGILGGADAKLFRNVFAIGLDELRSMDSLSEDGVRERIFSAGILGAGQSARLVLKTLQSRSDELLRPRGAALISDLLRQLEDEERALADAQGLAAEYPNILRREQELSAQIDNLKEQRRENKRKQDAAKLMVETWPVFVEYKKARADLDVLAFAKEYPSEARETFIGLQHEKKNAAEELKGVVAELERLQALQKERSEVVDGPLKKYAGQLETQFACVAAQREKLSHLRILTGKIEAKENTLEDHFFKLGVGWSAERVQAFDTTIPKRDEIRSWDDRLDRASRELEKQQNLLEQLEDQCREHTLKKEESLQKVTEGESLSSEDLETLDKNVRKLRSELHQSEVLATRIGALKETATVLGNASVRSSRAAIWGLCFFCVLLVCGGSWHVLAGDPFSGVLLFLSAAAVLVVCIILTRSARAAVSPKNPNAQLRELDDEYAESLELCRKTADVLGLSEHCSMVDLEEKEIEVRQLRRAVESRMRFREEAEVLEGEVQVLSEKLESRTIEKNRAEDRLKSLTGQWEELQESLCVSKELTPQGALDFFNEVEKTRDLLTQKTTLQEELDGIVSEIRTFDEGTLLLLRNAGVVDSCVEERSSEELMELLSDSSERCLAYRQAVDRFQTTEDSIGVIDSKREKAERRVAAARENECSLFKQVGVDTEEEFLEGLECFEQIVSLKRTVDDRMLEITRRIGDGEEASRILQELERGEKERWNEELRLVADELDDQRSALDRAFKERGAEETKRKLLGESTDIPGREASISSLKEEISRALHRWRIHQTAKVLIESTLLEYTRNRQPTVLSEASKRFAVVTGGRYERIVQQDEGESLAIVDSQGKLKRPEELSRGTAEQLYLCLRLGLVGEFAQRSEALPLVLDDIFVNFDPMRAKALVEVLVQCAKQYQILIFSCHPWTEEILTDVVPGIRVCRL